MKHHLDAFTNLDKVLWPKDAYTKADLIGYYEKIAPFLLPHLKGRPISLNRFPSGITGEHFFQKNMRGRLPHFVDTVTVRSKTTGKNVRYIICNNLKTLLYLANLGCIEIHTWNSRRGSLDKPDYIIFDLDPGPKSSFDDVVTVAESLHQTLEEKRVRNYCKTSGKRGLHVYAPIERAYSYDKAREFARYVAEAVVEKLPDIASVQHWPKDRTDKVFIDVMRNAKGQTTVAPYSLRPVAGAPVSTPLSWSEVKRGLAPERFAIETIFRRLERIGDIWLSSVRRIEKDITNPAILSV